MTGRSQSALALQASPSWPRPWNPASPMRWSATAWTVSDGKMGICTAGTTSRRMRSGSRRASSMAMRPAPRRPRFSLRPAARAGAGLHGKAALIHPPVQRRRRSGLHRDRQAVLARPARSGACASLAPWFDDWISQDNLGDPGRLMVALFPPGPRPEEAAGAGRAASQPGCAPPLRQPLLDRRRACVSMARRPACARRRPGLSGGSRPPTPWTRRSTRMDDRSGTTAPWWGRARTGA